MSGCLYDCYSLSPAPSTKVCRDLWPPAKFPNLAETATCRPPTCAKLLTPRENLDKPTKMSTLCAGVALVAPALDPAPRLALGHHLLGVAARDWPRGGAGSDWPRRSHEGSVSSPYVCGARAAIPGRRWEGAPVLSAPASCGGRLGGFEPGCAVRGGFGWEGPYTRDRLSRRDETVRVTLRSGGSGFWCETLYLCSTFAWG